MAEESPLKPFYSVLVLAFVCSALVAGAAVGLRPQQEANRRLDQQKHILYAAGLFDSTKSIEQMFAPVETKVVELASGRFAPPSVIDPKTFNQRKAAGTDDKGLTLASAQDLAGLRRVERYSLVYLVKDGEKIDQIILPVRGKGLWSTMYAYVALDGDLTTIKGISFYEHGETPGLGGEIENKRWQEGWRGKQLFDTSGNLQLEVVKGSAATDGPASHYQIDGLSGATLTTKGIDDLMEFWFGEHGFKQFITHMKNKDIRNG